MGRHDKKAEQNNKIAICTRSGCGRRYEIDDNDDDECRYHGEAITLKRKAGIRQSEQFLWYWCCGATDKKAPGCMKGNHQASGHDDYESSSVQGTIRSSDNKHGTLTLGDAHTNNSNNNNNNTLMSANPAADNKRAAGPVTSTTPAPAPAAAAGAAPAQSDGNPTVAAAAKMLSSTALGKNKVSPSKEAIPVLEMQTTRLDTIPPEDTWDRRVYETGTDSPAPAWDPVVYDTRSLEKNDPFSKAPQERQSNAGGMMVEVTITRSDEYGFSQSFGFEIGSNPQLNLRSGLPSMIVSGVDRKGPAAELLRVGDLILELNHASCQRITLEEAQRIMETTTEPSVTLRVLRLS